MMPAAMTWSVSLAPSAGSSPARSPCISTRKAAFFATGSIMSGRGEPELDPAVLCVILRLVAGGDRVVRAHAGRDEPVFRHAIGDQLVQHGEGACRGEVEIGFVRPALDGLRVGIAIHR